MKNLMLFTLLSLFCFTPMKAQADMVQRKDTINKIYVGTYTRKEGHVDGKAKGIYLLNQDPNTGNLNFVCTAAEMINPSFVKVGKMGKYVYAVSELGPQDGDSGVVHSFEIQEDGSLKSIGKLGTGGFAPCHIALDRSGKFAFVSNYMGGVVMVYKIGSDGSLEKSQELKLENSDSAHAHSVKISGDNRYAYIADLGNDKIWVYRFNIMTGKLEPHKQNAVTLEKGAGPRHLSFAKNGSFLYSVNELNSTVSAFAVKSDGSLDHLQNISALPDSFIQPNSAADIHIHPSGKFLYTSNRGHNSIAIFQINSDSGKLTHVDYVPVAGKTPRNFAISPYGKYLYAASQDTGNITTYKINEDTGKLKPQEPVFQVKTPVCLEFVK
ncbi:6-phosphogluconolactonase [Christiangramia gaetbulicola]|uniref:6-phosphogluconolactonase n=1 Tax=Christiangramia gaetbulicola TaxID=703340 RepID=A0A2T6AGQ7_9FLAO|nr:lactonase family protein [Christiangramia gaetbulicola]PTX42976.1 6-phosphogluconolactonase [Christiangramia gaetbulicola]